MALFCFYCRDGEDSETLRKLHLAEQRKHMAEHDQNYLTAGPLTNRKGEFVGSLLIIEADSEEEARAAVNDDPYVTGGVWQSIRVDKFEPVKGRWKDR